MPLLKLKKRIINMFERAFLSALKKNEFEQQLNKNPSVEPNLIDITKKIAKLQAAEYVIEKMNDSFVAYSTSELYNFILTNFEIKGAIMEFGVYRGETINYFAEKLPDNRIFGFDSFEGLPEKWRLGHEKGFFSTGGEFPYVRNNVTLIKGWFENSIPEFIQENNLDNIALFHIDCDLYSSTKTIFNFLGDKIKKGTIILFDEYFNYPGWKEGEFKAFQEFLLRTGLNYRYIAFNANHEQVAVIIN